MSSTTRFAQVQKHPRFRLNAPVDVVMPAADVEQLPLENISLGGVFIRTTHPAPPGSALRLRLHSADDAVTLGLHGRVVHVIDEAESVRKAHPPGMGVQFEGLSEQTRAMLERFVEGLVEAARRERARRAAARFTAPATVTVREERSVVAALWAQGLSLGALFVEAPQAPPLGTRVAVHVGRASLQGEVVHVDDGKGFGLQLLDLEGKKREALARFAEGTAESIDVDEVKVVGPPLGKLLAAARRLFVGIEEDDPFGGVGLPVTAGDVDVQQRCEALRRLFSAPRPDASPPQQARIEAACRAVARLEPLLLARVAAMRREAQLMTQPAPDVRDVAADQVKELVAEAGACERGGRRLEARRALEHALELAPDDELVRRRLAALNESIDLARAVDLVKSAEVFVQQGVGMKEEAVKRAREAARLTRNREVRLLAIRVLAKAGELADAVLLAEELVDVEPRDSHALQALLVLHERTHDWRAAARAGEALLRMKPGDVELQKRVKRIIAQARK